jgi:3-hydroxybutyryl-CoA dehydrogenase
MKTYHNWNVAVIGAGTMGLSIAQYFATNGFAVRLYNRTARNLDRAMTRIRESLQIQSGLRTSAAMDVDEILKRVQPTTKLGHAVENADIVFECVAEDAEIKKAVFKQLDEKCGSDTYLCSDTSALNIYGFLEVSHPDRLLITHFFNPAHLMQLVEIVSGPDTPEKTLQEVREFLQFAGKAPITLRQCIPGFVANRLTLALAREAYYLLESGIASAEDIDSVITTTFGPRYTFEGIFDLYDNIGLDVGFAVATGLLPHLCNSDKPSKILEEKVKKGELGIKTGTGIKDYAGKDLRELKNARETKLIKILERISRQ